MIRPYNCLLVSWTFVTGTADSIRERIEHTTKGGDGWQPKVYDGFHDYSSFSFVGGLDKSTEIGVTWARIQFLDVIQRLRAVKVRSIHDNILFLLGLLFAMTVDVRF